MQNTFLFLFVTFTRLNSVFALDIPGLGQNAELVSNFLKNQGDATTYDQYIQAYGNAFGDKEELVLAIVKTTIQSTIVTASKGISGISNGGKGLLYSGYEFCEKTFGNSFCDKTHQYNWFSTIDTKTCKISSGIICFGSPCHLKKFGNCGYVCDRLNRDEQQCKSAANKAIIQKQYARKLINDLEETSSIISYCNLNSHFENEMKSMKSKSGKIDITDILNYRKRILSSPEYTKQNKCKLISYNLDTDARCGFNHMSAKKYVSGQTINESLRENGYLAVVYPHVGCPEKPYEQENN